MDRSDFEAALALPFARASSFDTVAVGTLVTLASFATPLAGVLLVGYLARLVRAGTHRATALPTFDDVPDLAVEGTRLSAVLVALQLPAVAVASVVFGSSGVPLTASTVLSDPRLLQYVDLSVFGVVGLVVAGCLALGGAYLGAAATVALARERSVAASLAQIRPLAFDPSVRSAVAASALVVFGGRLLGVFVGVVPFVGVVLTAGVSFLTVAAAATLLGRGTATPTAATSVDHRSSAETVGSA